MDSQQSRNVALPSRMMSWVFVALMSASHFFKNFTQEVFKPYNIVVAFEIRMLHHVLALFYQVNNTRKKKKSKEHTIVGIIYFTDFFFFCG